MAPNKVAILGSGNWGSCAVKIIGKNVLSLPDFDNEVRVWVYEEMVNGKKLTDIINSEHENVKYLPGCKFTENVVADPDPVSTVKGANYIVVVIPHQFIDTLLNNIKDHIPADVHILSMTKGMSITDSGMNTMTQVIKRSLGVQAASLGGANIANEVGKESFCETTIGCKDPESAKVWKRLYQTSYFQVNTVSDVIGVEFCGALKNAIAVAAGLIDGLDLGNNAKSAIIRIGFLEMRRLAKLMSGDEIQESTFLESCGAADLIATCYGGRNRRLAEAFAKTGKSMQELEKEMLNGQKLQGYLTAQEVYSYIDSKDKLDDFPLLTKVYRICYGQLPPEEIYHDLNVDFTKDTIKGSKPTIAKTNRNKTVSVAPNADGQVGIYA